MRSFSTLLTRPSRRFLPAVFLLALALRLGFVLGFHARHPGFVFPDSQQYDIVARNVLEGKGFVLDDRKAQRPPAYPLFMVLCGRNVLAIRVAQAVIGAASCLLVFKLCLLLFESEPAARLAAVGMAVEPFNTFFTGLALTETLYTAGFLAAMLFLARLLKEGSLWPAAAAGALLGLGVLLRPSLLLFPLFMLPFWQVLVPPVKPTRSPPLMLPFWQALGRKLKALQGWLLLSACVAAVITPWTVRNLLVLGAFVPTTTQGGESLWEANNPRADGGPMMDQGIFPENLDKLPEVERDRALGQAARQFILENPGRFLALCVRKFLRFWNVLPNFGGYRTPVYNAISFVSAVTVYLLAVVGIVTVWRANWRPALLCLLPVLYTSGMHLVFVGSVRYRVPVIPYLLCLAAVGLGRWICSNAPRNKS